MLDFNKNAWSKKNVDKMPKDYIIFYIFLTLLLIQLLSFEVVWPIYGLISED